MDELKVLERHLRHWHTQGLINEALAGRLRQASEGLDRGRTGKVVSAALALLGGGLLLAGLVLVVAENWQAIPRGVKLGAWALLQAGFVCGAAAFRRRWPDRPAFAETLAVVAGGWVMAGIALVSEIYQLESRAPNAFWLWLALWLPAVWLLRERAAAAVAFAALTLALAVEVGEGPSWVKATSVDGLWAWLGVPLLAGAVVSGLPRPWPGLRAVLGGWVFLEGTLGLLVLGASQQFGRSDLGRGWLVVAPGLLLALLWPGRVLPWDPTTSRLLLALPLLPWVLLGSRYDQGQVPDMIAVGLAWVVQLATAVVLLRNGARTGSATAINAGYLALLAGILVRYFDFFGNRLDGGLALAGTGALVLFVLFATERARRRTLRLAEVR